METQNSEEKRFRITYYNSENEKLYHIFVWCNNIDEAKALLEHGMIYRRSKRDSIVKYGKIRYDNNIKKED